MSGCQIVFTSRYMQGEDVIAHERRLQPLQDSESGAESVQLQERNIFDRRNGYRDQYKKIWGM